MDEYRAGSHERRRVDHSQGFSERSRNAEDAADWLGAVIARFKPIIGMAILLSFLINVAALCVPFFVVHVYDLGIASRSGLVVFYLAIGAGIVILGDLSLRYIRARVMAYFGSRVDALIGMTAFQQLVQMPI